MSIIYLIENDINDKKYVGLTTRNISIRWREHLRHSDQYIDKAIQKYGREHFSIIELEECDDSVLDEREKYWISFYDSFNNGYNLTPGGREENLIFLPDKKEEVKQMWNRGYGQKDIIEATKLNVETVHNYLLKSGVSLEDIRNRQREKISKIKSKPILQYDLQGNLIKKWASTSEATKAGYDKSTIQRSLYGITKKPRKYIWKFEE